MIVQVLPVVDHAVRNLCQRPYHGHESKKKPGCPNYGKKTGCPPGAKLFDDVYDLEKPVYAVYNAFMIGEHVDRMRHLHSDWSENQLYCCLYWQTKARKQLLKMIIEFQRQHPGYTISVCPEAMGVNITATMRNVGVKLEWPPRVVAYQVALAGILAKAEGRQNVSQCFQTSLDSRV
jgi:predicted metal-binding protein